MRSLKIKEVFGNFSFLIWININCVTKSSLLMTNQSQNDQSLVGVPLGYDTSRCVCYSIV